MQRSIAIVWSVIVLTVCQISIAKYSGGDGSAGNPWQISTKQDLLDMGVNTDDSVCCFVMTNDINLTGDVYYQAMIPYQFNGQFDGDNHIISGLVIYNYDVAGLFGYINPKGKVKNVYLQDIDISGIDQKAGGIAYQNEGLIENCHVVGIVRGGGGIAGCSILYDCQQGGSKIENCTFKGQIPEYYGTGYSGGIVGITNLAQIINCSAEVEINGGSYCGGIVGQNGGGNIKSCFAKGTITANSYAGGLCGDTFDQCGYVGLIDDCYTDVKIYCYSYAGGFCGQGPGPYGHIIDCYSAGYVDYYEYYSSYVGAFIGNVTNSYPCISNCYFLQSTAPGGSYAQGLTEQQMQQHDSFFNWDFEGTWGIGEGQTYPFLRKAPAGDLNYDNKTDYLDLAILARNWLMGSD